MVKKLMYLVLIGVTLAGLLLILQISHYKWMILSNTFEWYAFVIALIFMVVGIWSGVTLFNRRTKVGEKIVEVNKEIYLPNILFDKPSFLKKNGISEREFEVLVAVSKGMSNQEIADNLYISLSTVKTHISNLFLKLGVSRRVQLIQKLREQGFM